MHQLHPTTSTSSRLYPRHDKELRPTTWLSVQLQAVDICCRVGRNRTKVRATLNKDDRSSGTNRVDRTLYGSRVAVGQQLLRFLLEAPDINDPVMPGSGSSFAVATYAAPASPSSEGPLVAVTETPFPLVLDTPSPMAADATASHVLARVAALVREVATLMVSHRDVSTLLNALNTCQARRNAARTSGSAGGGAKSPEQRVRSDFGRNPSWSSIGGAMTSTSNPPMSSSKPASKGRAMVPASAAFPLSSEPPKADRAPPLHSGETMAATTSMLVTAPSGEMADASGALCCSTDGEWDWRRVRRVVIIGLGSLGAYQAALRSGRQTERESSRASSRLYQLALSLVLASPTVLPGLLDAVRPSTAVAASAPAVAAPAIATEVLTSKTSVSGGGRIDGSEGREAEPTQRSRTARMEPNLASKSQPPAPAAAAAAAAASLATAAAPAAAAGPAPAVAPQGAAAAAPAAAAAAGGPLAQATGHQVQYFDPEYLEWDIRLIQNLWPSPHGDNVVALSRAGMVVVNDPVTQGVTAAAAGTAAPPAALTAYTPTLFYAPCCPRELYDKIVQQNLAAGTLHNVALIGNSLRAQAETALLLRAFGGKSRSAFTMGGVGGRSCTGSAFGPGSMGAVLGIDSKGKEERALDEEGMEAFVELVSSGRVVEVMLPDFAAHGVATAVHLFL